MGCYLSNVVKTVPMETKTHTALVRKEQSQMNSTVRDTSRGRCLKHKSEKRVKYISQMVKDKVSPGWIINNGTILGGWWISWTDGCTLEIVAGPRALIHGFVSM